MSGWWDSFTRFLSRRWLVAAEPPAPPRPELVGQLYSPGAKCYQAGVYALVRAGELVTRPDGLLELATMSASNIGQLLQVLALRPGCASLPLSCSGRRNTDATR